MESGLVLIAVADGAGSASLSQIGAQTVATAAVTKAAARLDLPNADKGADEYWQELLAEAVTAAREAVESEASARSTSVSDLDTTLLFAAAGRDVVAASQIGDGALIIEADGVLQSLVRPAATEYLNETVFLTSAAGLDNRQTTIWRGRPGYLAVMSDGLQMAALRMPDDERGMRQM